MTMARRGALAALAAFTAAPQRAASAPLAVLHLGTTMADDITSVLYGVHAGLYAKAGLDVQVAAAQSGAAVAAAVMSGAYELGKSSLVSLMNARLHGLPLVLIAPASIYDTRAPFGQIVTAADTPGRTGRDFDGKLVAVPSLNDLNQVAVSAWVDQGGGDSRTLRFVELPNNATGPALAEHRVDLAQMQYPALADALATGKVRAVGPGYTGIGSRFLITGYFVTADFAAKYPDRCRAFATATATAARYANAHHAETAPLVAEATKIPLATIRTMVRTPMGVTLRLSDIVPMIDAAFKYHMIPQAFPARDFVWSGASLS